MNKWPHLVYTHSRAEILTAVKDPDWQTCRKSMKGKPTPEKLVMLEGWLVRPSATPRQQRQIQTDNYIGALRRGGQLNEAMEVIR